MRLALIFALFWTLTYAGETGRGWWRGIPVHYQTVDGVAVTEGDILLERVDPTESAEQKANGRDALVRSGSRFLWPNLTVPYVIDPALTTASRVREAATYWNENTPIRLVERTTEENYVKFVRKDGECSSYVGMIGREQPINLGTGCSTGAIIHEIGHAVGLFHEQSRTDRNLWLQVSRENVDARHLLNFEQAFSVGQDAGGYDYGSIMHYQGREFSRNGDPVLRSIPAGIPLGQRQALSAADVDGVRRLYGLRVEETTITTFPTGLEVIVDGERVKAPRTYQWAPGSQHTLAVPEPQTSGAYRLLFGRWSNDGLATQQITAGPENTVYTASFIRQAQVPLTVAGGRGTLEISPPSPDGWFADGTVVTVKAVPAADWKFGGWNGFGAFGLHGGSPNPLRFVVQGAETRYGAVFTQRPLTTIVTEPPNLEVEVDGETVTTPESFAWTPGSTHTVNIASTSQSNPGDSARHEFTGWSNDGPVSQMITAGSADTNLTARFNTRYNVSLEPFGAGQIEVTPQGTDEFWPAGTTLTVRSLPVAPNRLAGWGGDASGADEITSVIVDRQKLITATFSAPNQIAPGGLVNAASFAYGGGVSPGTLMTIFGVEIGPGAPTASRLSGGRLATELDGYRVTFDEFSAPLVYLTRNQASVIVPWGVRGRAQVTLRLIGPSFQSRGVVVPVVASDPAIFTANSSGQGQAAALNENGSVNSAQSPAEKGSVVVLYATGAGEITPAPADGEIVSGSSLPRPVQPVRVRVNGQLANVLYAGAAPGQVAGVVQLNVQIPADCPSGQVPVSFAVGKAANAGLVTIAVR